MRRTAAFSVLFASVAFNVILLAAGFIVATPWKKTEAGASGLGFVFVRAEAAEEQPDFDGAKPVAASETEPAAIKAPVAEATVKRMAEIAEFTGFIRAVEHVDIRPRISGHIDSIHFSEGALVKAGDLLVQIDPRPYEAAVERAAAELAQAREHLALARLQYARASDLVEDGAVSRESYDEAKSRRRVLEAEVKVAEAALRIAELDAFYTRVAAPVSGRVGRILTTKGNLVSRETPLTTLVSVDPAHVLFDVDERVYLQALNAQRSESDGATPRLDVSVQLLGETDYRHKGRLDFIDNHVRTGAGTVQARAVLPNPGGRLTPGLFARIRLELALPRETVFIDERAVGADQDGRYVFALNNDNIVEYRPVRLGRRIEGLRTVRAGLEAGELVVVGGLHRIRPGQAVVPVRVDGDADTGDRAEVAE